MQGKIVFLLEEPSMKVLLDKLLPRLFPEWMEGTHFICLQHEGKNDLDKSIPRKLKAWQEPDARFVIVRDNDNANCIELKRKLHAICEQTGRPETLIRLVCQELESWYLGDLQALDNAFDTTDATLNTPKNRKRFANPDQWQKPSVEIKRLLPSFQKIAGARAIAEHLNVQNNRSRSFQVLFEGIQYLARQMEHAWHETPSPFLLTNIHKIKES
ncbi:hypothetical protein AGMMS49960_03260 [Betaproteobacteria bacterium]|nr:hypothetical protein AGMMS49543_01640 [Betaproteobacteria bacterium]GHT99009.1 hypothetical protein AGMMS49960_03260 [Betaproteobacteria bacterium]GHU19555.1 hypothetical protein AGMMS50243_11840 [Betaproteobacteria bacterium]